MDLIILIVLRLDIAVILIDTLAATLLLKLKKSSKVSEGTINCFERDRIELRCRKYWERIVFLQENGGYC